jgi:hypothetical protein
MKVLVACEESQTITKEYRSKGVEAYSCDIKDCTGGHPEWHIKGDAIKEAYSGKYDLMIAHPPCTYLSVSGSGWLYNKDGSRNEDRYKQQSDALDFVRKLMDAPITRIAIENPVSVIASHIRPADQMVQPYFFGDRARKTTCFWLKNLPLLKPTDIVDEGEDYEWVDSKTGKRKKQPLWYYEAFVNAKSPEERRTLRSKTFIGLAKAIADQWGKKIENYPITKQLDLFK